MNRLILPGRRCAADGCPVFIALYLLFVSLLGSCAKEQPARHYLFLGHPYNWADTSRVDPRLERLSYSRYDGVWLGGDVCARTGRKPGNMAYLDSIFDFRKVHWALGNHDFDFGDPQAILAYLQRPSFYTSWEGGFCLMVLNTNLFHFYAENPPQRDCAEKQAQLDMIRAVTDTIRHASHLVILHHHALFNGLKVDAKGDTLRPFNFNPMLIRATCDPASDIGRWVYPLLCAVQERGVQAVLIGGDLGMQAKSFEFRSPEGVWMLGSGINNSVDPEYAPEYVKDFSPDKVLELTYAPKERRLSWRFTLLDELVKEQKE
ncbi:MAG: metallophosphoesterase [Lewinellaceae bacterium]|nr:metallophosphoesterase [Lewinellaceae bacterium]